MATHNMQSMQAAQTEPKYRILMVHDTNTKALVLVPSDQLLDLVSIWNHSELRLQPLRSREAIKFFGQAALNTEKGLQKLMGLKVYMDSGLNDLDLIEAVEPYTGRVFEIRRSWIQKPVVLKALALTTTTISNAQPGGNDAKVITQAVERFTSLRVKQRLEDTLGMPALPLSMKKLIALRSDPIAGIDDLVPLVRVDPSLAAQVMSWAASPYYAAPTDVQSVDDAVVRVLGFDLVLNLALGVAMGQTLAVPDDTPREGVPFWQQAVYTAALCELLCKKVPVAVRPKLGMVYLAGLLHNFGYLVLAHVFPSYFSLLSRYIEANPHMSSEYIEQQVLNVTREQIGSWLLDSWSLPATVCEAVRHQQDPDYQGEAQQEVGLLYIASRLLRAKGLGDGPEEEIPGALFKRLQISREDADEAVEKILENRTELEALVNSIAPAKAS
ncbi:HDOD domain-containing protein [Aliamphritea ceti]|uniref:HDOD domain-containing protein n=1 Tax=Aliamphritea ceti TaxID=1524258 RepID=UPI0021C45E5B|nr:HDOD domain-containing protein [Aliamphritea ceti]